MTEKENQLAVLGEKHTDLTTLAVEAASPEAVKFATRLYYNGGNVKQTAVELDIDRQKYYKNNEFRDQVDGIIEALKVDVVEASKQFMTNMVAEAMQVKLAGLQSGNEALRQKVATEILDRALGKPSSKHDDDQPKSVAIYIKQGIDPDEFMEHFKMNGGNNFIEGKAVVEEG